MLWNVFFLFLNFLMNIFEFIDIPVEVWEWLFC